MKSLYDERYFERGIETELSCYSNYRWMPELTIPFAVRLIEYLKISREDTILDFGCAKGYLVKAFRLIDRKAFGYDISEYALSRCHEDISEFLFSNKIKENYNWVISKDVFEHIPYEEIDDILRKLKIICDNMFCIVPLGRDGKYEISAYELDKTHVIREPLEWWENKLLKAGFQVVDKKYKIRNIKQNWACYERGNGFFVCK